MMGLHGHGGGRRGGRGSRSRAPMADINVTPLVDVMLVLLIIFMVTAPLLTAGVPVALPDSRAKALDQPEREPVDIALDAEGRLFIGEDQVSMADLPERLEVIALEDAEAEEPRTIMLRADRDLDYGLVMRVMGELNRAGLSRVSMVTTHSANDG
ncbi:MAG: ExbD/TolR family protein [Sphingopyxis sp.]|jgi:biopolymer transport protein TolR|nr:ExbD/TolR family protein [Sphingopyxis sp.]